MSSHICEASTPKCWANCPLNDWPQVLSSTTLVWITLVPFYIKYGFVCKPVIVKAYICVFVSFSAKAVHLELVSDLTTDAIIASLRRFISRRGKPSTIWSDHGTNFIGAAREIKELVDFLEERKTQGAISKFCSAQNIVWKVHP